MVLPHVLERGRFKVAWRQRQATDTYWRFCCYMQNHPDWRRLPLAEYDTDLSVATTSEADLVRLSLRILDILQEHGGHWVTTPNEYDELHYADALRLVAHVSLEHLEVSRSGLDWLESAVDSTAKFLKPKQPDA